MGSAVAGKATSTVSARPDGNGEAAAPDRPHPPARPVHRWRDLDRGSRRWALAVAAALVLAPVMAFALFTPDWTPQGDPALMALRSLDVGTSRTPLLGQPSQSIEYAGTVASVHHPGPLHFYLLALPIRVLGGALGMSLVSVAIVATCLVTSAWAVFRQLGRTAGVVAAVVLAAVTFSTGAASMINPVSSNIAGYPLLATGVLMWCVACADVRLLPVAAAAVSFTAQQHLSVLPATAVVAVGGLALGAAAWWRAGGRSDPVARAELARWARRAGLVALVLWAPVLAQQLFGARGNLGEMLWFARNGGHDTLGLAPATWQLAHTLGLPPLLGRTEVTGTWLNTRPSVLAWLSAGLVTAVVVGLCLRWRAARPRAARLGAMAGVVALAGLVNGSSVPTGLEQNRITFYHWSWVLAFLVALVLGLAAAEWAGRAAWATRPAAVPVLAGLAVVVVAVPAVVSVSLDRRANTAAAAYSSLDRDVLETLASAAADHADQLGDRPLVISRDEPAYVMYRETLAFALIERGVDVRFPLTSRFFVHDDHLVDRDRLDGGLVLVVDRAVAADAPDGELIAEADLRPGAEGIDLTAYRALLDEAGAADRLRLGPAVTAELAEDELIFVTTALEGLVDDPEDTLLDPVVLAFLAGRPQLAEPALDPVLAGRLLDSIEAAGDDDWSPEAATGLRLYLVDRDEMLDFATPQELGRPDG